MLLRIEVPMKISLIVPVLNEEEAIPVFYRTVRSFPDFQGQDVEILFINDGSTDCTEAIIGKLSEKDELVKPISFTRHFGKEAGIMCGLHYATGDVVIPIDVDLQDPIEVIPAMLDKWADGADMVLAKRIDRSSDSFLKRMTAKLFYKLNNLISNLKLEENVGDFRLLDRSMVDELKQLPERNLFMKGILSWAGGRTAIVTYKRAPRSAGKSKFNGWKLWNLAMEGFTSFSTVLLRIWGYIGMAVAGFAFLYGLFMIGQKLILGNDVPGYPSMMVTMLFLGGIELMGIGVLGEYIGRIYIETKHRPRYVVKDMTSREKRRSLWEGKEK